MTIITQSLSRLRRNTNPLKNWFVYSSGQKACYAENAAEPITFAEEGETEEEKLKRVRNISRLNDLNYRKLHGIPNVTPYDFHQRTLRWHRKQVGIYGTNCGIDPAICFTTKEEMQDLQDYEKVAFDKTIQQIREEAQQKLAQEKEERRLREKQVAENLVKVEAWKQEIRDRMVKKEAEVTEAKKKRERLIEEVRRHFGYTIDTRDEKFQIMLELKEVEQKKQAKLEKKKKKDELFMKRLASLEAKSSPSGSEKTVNAEDLEKSEE